jgi:hypothetical protein
MTGRNAQRPGLYQARGRGRVPWSGPSGQAAAMPGLLAAAGAVPGALPGVGTGVRTAA